MARALISGSSLIGMLVWVSSAAAASSAPAKSAYNGQANVQSQVAGAVDAQTLPFTGLSLALIVGVAVLLLVSGIMLRRASRRAQ